MAYLLSFVFNVKGSQPWNICDSAGTTLLLIHFYTFPVEASWITLWLTAAPLHLVFNKAQQAVQVIVQMHPVQKMTPLLLRQSVLRLLNHLSSLQLRQSVLKLLNHLSSLKPDIYHGLTLRLNITQDMVTYLLSMKKSPILQWTLPVELTIHTQVVNKYCH